ncbi:glycosyltransferase family 2 protein [Microbacterium sp. ZW T5_45]|uniref:glycosyltransferase family 2 protein n=1 Tax=Microbacterium sp. ZW T5_45 TaxID=3378080 RepID=UPI003852FA5F
MQPIVSVVMATRNRPTLLRRAVASVFAQQTVQPIEVVLVYDGDEHDIAELDELIDLERGPHALRALRNARTPGLAGARNTGILEASAPLIAFCDDDDEWKPSKLAAQLPLFDDPSVVLAATGIEIHSSGGAHARPSPASVVLDDLLRSRITELHPSSFVVRADALRGDLGLVDEHLPASYGEDYDLLLRAAKVGRVVAVPEPHTVIHWDRTSYFSEKWQGIADGLSYLLAKHPEFDRSGVGQARIEGQIAFAHGALGDRRRARSWARRAIGHDARQPRAYLAMIVGMGLVSGQTVVAALNKRGRGM